MNIEDPALKAVVVKAIFDSIPQEAREKMLTEAVASLLVVPPKDTWGRPPQAKLSEIFENEVYNFARQTVREKFASDPVIQDGVKKLAAAALTQLLTDESIATNIAAILSRSIENARKALDRD